MKLSLLVTLLLIYSVSIFSQPVAQQRCDRMGKGMNLSNWLEAYWQAGWPTADGYTRADLVKMKEAGIESIRLPICFANITDTAAPYFVDTNHVLFARIDSVISWCNDLELNLIIDNHHNWDIFNQNWRSKKGRFAHLWSVVSAHYSYLDPERYTFELLNEPAFFIDLDSLNLLFSQAIDSVRQHTAEHSIIVSPNFSGNGAVYSFAPALTDTNLIYTWHSYDPYQFTHQGFTWANPSVPLGTTFPGAFDQGLNNAWDAVISWRNTYNKPLFLGEFGTGVNGDDDSRCNWLQFFGERIDSVGMSWFYWDWRWDFALFEGNVVSEDSIVPCFKRALHLYGDTTVLSVQQLAGEPLAAELFPNPASSFSGCYLRLADNLKAMVEVYDVTGKKIYHDNFAGHTELPSNKWQKGLYLVVVNCGDKYVRRKLVVQ